MDWHTFALYVATESALALSPGPAVMMVVACGLAGGARRSLLAALGILSANAIFFAVSATGLGALLAASRGLFVAVKWAGAAYLVYLGASAILGRASPITVSAERPQAGSPWRVWLGGLTLQLANPKSLLFFVAILPQFVDARRAVPPQMVWLALGSIIPEFLILGGYGWVAGRARSFAAQPRWARFTDRAAGALLLCAAALVASVGRS